MPESRDETASGRIDWPGAALVVASLGALTFGLTLLSEEGPNYAVVIAAPIGRVRNSSSVRAEVAPR